MKISYEGGGFRLVVSVSHLSVPDGVDRLGRPNMTRGRRVEGKLWLPWKHYLRVWHLLLSGAPYAVGLIRGQDGRGREGEADSEGRFPARGRKRDGPKTRRRFGRLDGEMALHNGQTRFRQESFRSVWFDLRQLALSSR